MKKLRLKYATSLFLAFALCAPSASINAGPLKKGWQVLLTAIIAYTANSSAEFTTNGKRVDGDSLLGYSAIQGATHRDLASADLYPSKTEVADQLLIPHDQGLFDHLNPLENKGFVSTKKEENHKESVKRTFRRPVASEDSIQGYLAIQAMVHNKVQPQFYFSKVEMAKDIASMLIDGLDIDEVVKMGVSPYELFAAEFPQVNAAQRRRLQMNTTEDSPPPKKKKSSKHFLHDFGGDSRSENIFGFTILIIECCILYTLLKGVLVWTGKGGHWGDNCKTCCNYYFVYNKVYNDCCKQISNKKYDSCDTFWDVPTCGLCTSCCVYFWICCNLCPESETCKIALGCERCYNEKIKTKINKKITEITEKRKETDGKQETDESQQDSKLILLLKRSAKKAGIDLSNPSSNDNDGRNNTGEVNQNNVTSNEVELYVNDQKSQESELKAVVNNRTRITRYGVPEQNS